MRYQPPFGSTNPNAHYVDRNTAGATSGSRVPAAAIEDPQREILYVITQAGLTPIDDDLTQLHEAIMLLTNVPFASNSESIDDEVDDKAISPARLIYALGQLRDWANSAEGLNPGVENKIIDPRRLWEALSENFATDAESINAAIEGKSIDPSTLAYALGVLRDWANSAETADPDQEHKVIDPKRLWEVLGKIKALVAPTPTGSTEEIDLDATYGLFEIIVGQMYDTSTGTRCGIDFSIDNGSSWIEIYDDTSGSPGQTAQLLLSVRYGNYSCVYLQSGSTDVGAQYGSTGTVTNLKARARCGSGGTLRYSELRIRKA
ncbi:hypothetical protein [Pararhizobium sp. O133]|uniref:hypothetical protein n=1 Tax=Pararhizobium sp. O133 TaxID=3449278 RepID=UPI003F687AD4